MPPSRSTARCNQPTPHRAKNMDLRQKVTASSKRRGDITSIVVSKATHRRVLVLCKARNWFISEFTEAAITEVLDREEAKLKGEEEGAMPITFTDDAVDQRMSMLGIDSSGTPRERREWLAQYTEETFEDYVEAWSSGLAGICGVSKAQERRRDVET